LVEVAADGRILKRIVPAGTEDEHTKPVQGPAADYPVDGVLSELLAKRRINRGIESMAQDFRFLSFIVQSPLDPGAARPAHLPDARRRRRRAR
jgi:hypothetical protein